MATTEDRVGRSPGYGTGEVAIRPATLDDVEAVAAIEGASFSNPWHLETFRSLISQGRAHILVAEEAREVVGYSVAWWVMDQGELANLAVRREYQGRGTGGALLDRVLEDVTRAGVESLFLEVRVSNRPAQALYASRGFTRVAVRKDYYWNPVEDAWVLMRRVGR